MGKQKRWRRRKPLRKQEKPRRQPKRKLQRKPRSYCGNRTAQNTSTDSATSPMEKLSAESICVGRRTEKDALRRHFHVKSHTNLLNADKDISSILNLILFTQLSLILSIYNK